MKKIILFFIMIGFIGSSFGTGEIKTGTKTNINIENEVMKKELEYIKNTFGNGEVYYSEAKKTLKNNTTEY